MLEISGLAILGCRVVHLLNYFKKHQAIGFTTRRRSLSCSLRWQRLARDPGNGIGFFDPSHFHLEPKLYTHPPCARCSRSQEALYGNRIGKAIEVLDPAGLIIGIEDVVHLAPGRPDGKLYQQLI